MKLTIPSFDHGDRIPDEFAFCVPDPENHVAMGANRNPHLKWSDVPEGTQSFALIVHDPDVPSRPDDVNQEGRTVPHDLPRVDFFHWVLVDIPATMREIPAGADSDGITPRGKELGPTDLGVRGRNDYTDWFKGDADMEGTYGGYDGPCPPWNDERLHHYYFTLYALDVPSLDLDGAFGGHEARAALKDHVLAKAEWMGTYTLYEELLRQASPSK